MSNPNADLLRVAGWARALAWLFVAASTLGGCGVALMIWKGKPAPALPWYQLAALVAAAIWIAPPFWRVAISGRVPRTWPGLGEYLWRTERRRK